MPAAPTIPGCPTWVDLATSDQARAIEFYTGLFGWTCEEPDPLLGGYANFRRDGARVAGCLPAMPDTPADRWGVHFATEDAAKTAELVTAHGGRVIAPPMEVQDLGTLGIFTDPGGSAFGVWRAGTHDGFAVLDEPGAPSWFELHTRTYDDTLRFYVDVLGWTTQTVSDVPGFRYTVVQVDGVDRAGVMDGSGFLAEGDQGSWEVYWHSADVAATLGDVERLGGQVTHGVDDTPYGVLAVATDPSGAVFKLRTPPA